MTREVDVQLVEFIDSLSYKQSISPIDIKPSELHYSPQDLVQFPALEKLEESSIKERLELFRYLHHQFLEVMKHVNLDFMDLQPNVERWINKVKCFMFYQAKIAIFKPLLDSSEYKTSFSVSIDRTKSAALKNKGKTDTTAKFSVFGQLMDSLKCRQNRDFRSRDRIWKTQFLHEGAEDAGGVYNELITTISQELMSDFLPLFIPTPNQVRNEGTFRDCWTINPSAAASKYNEMWLFLGKLLGIAIRSSNHLNLSLAPLFWKHLLNEDTISKEDIKCIDECCYQTLHQLDNLEGVTEEDFASAFEGQNFTTNDSAGVQVVLGPGGEDKMLSLSNAKEYTELVARVRIEEGYQVFKIIRKGMSAVIPINPLRLFTWKQLEQMVCGSPDIDVEKLKQKSTLEGYSSSDPVITHFWEVLVEMTAQERVAFLRFVWGRSKLPISGEHANFKIAKLFADDSHLPVSHTCFFKLDLPPYSTKKVMREKLLYAISHCTAIDLDHVATGGFQEQH